MKNNTLLKGILILPFFLISSFVIGQPDADLPSEDQQILDDLIVDGSACIGQDCVNGESFGFDTIRLKENNLRIKFQDTSTSASFPTRDWQLTANDSSNGGANKFSIDDIDGGRTPFTIIAGAPSHSLFVSSAGRLGLGTSTPVVGIHRKTGNTPTLRLEQDGSSGFTPQTWDVAGNEANFFVRDATNGSTLPFRIKPGAKTSSIFIETDEVVVNEGGVSNVDFRVESDNEANLIFVDASTDRIGIGTGAPADKFHLETVDGLYQITKFGHQIFKNLNHAGTSKWGIAPRSTGEFSIAYGVPNADNVLVTSDSKLVINDLGNVGIGTTTPNAAARLDVRGGQIWHEGAMVHSDKRFKSNIINFDKGLAEVLKLNPVMYNYNGKIGLRQETRHIGILAQELKKHVPELVQQSEYFEQNKEGKKSKIGDYLAIRDNEVKYLFINAFKDQQAIINAQDQRIEQLEKSNQELIKQISTINDKLENLAFQDIELESKNASFLKQNSPNPFDGETTIGYFISENAGSASIQISDMKGQIMQTVTVNQKGYGQLNISAHNLARGNYNYSLIIDGEIVGTNRMVLAR